MSELSPSLKIAVFAAVTVWLPNLAAQVAPNSARIVRMINVGGHAMRVQTARLGERKPEEPIVVLESGALSELEKLEPRLRPARCGQVGI